MHKIAFNLISRETKICFIFLSSKSLRQSNNHILVNEQFGFRHASSTDIVSCKLTKNILTALNNKQSVGGIFCDLHKAFDCVNHDILLSKMEFCDISGKINNLIKPYLQDIREYW